MNTLHLSFETRRVNASPLRPRQLNVGTNITAFPVHGSVTLPSHSYHNCEQYGHWRCVNNAASHLGIDILNTQYNTVVPGNRD
jgi:hypothetical protein